MNYKHTQIGYITILIFIISLIFFIYTFTRTNFYPITIITTTSILLILTSFATLTVTTDNENLKIKFGYGIFFKNFPLKEIISAKIVKNKWYYGWGIRIWFWPKRIIFNISGLDAIEIKTINNETYRIGTDEPKKLETVIRRAMGGMELE